MHSETEEDVLSPLVEDAPAVDVADAISGI